MQYISQEKVMAETKEKVAFQELLGNKKSAFATELIRAHFSSTIQFISECESLIEQNNNQMLSKFTSCF
jgi:hypothetical protein